MEKIIDRELYISAPNGELKYANSPNPDCPGCYGTGDNGNYEPCPICMKHYYPYKKATAREIYLLIRMKSKIIYIEINSGYPCKIESAKMVLNSSGNDFIIQFEMADNNIPERAVFDYCFNYYEE